jgi:hypothetical protein
LETILKTQYEEEVFISKEPLSEKQFEMTIYGQTVERSMEDRSVYIRVNDNMATWLRGEDAIELGQMLIKHGNRALTANRINHQHIHMRRRLETHINAERIHQVIMEVTDEYPDNYGRGFKTYRVTPVWKEGMAPKYEEDFSFETIVYWSPFEKEFKAQLEKWGGDKVLLLGYDREEELKRFKKCCEESD